MSTPNRAFRPDALDWMAFGFGAGLAPRAPGTVGTLVAVPLYWFLRDLSPWLYAATVLLFFVFGVWACGRTARRLGDPDPGSIVWDEIVGFLVTMFMAPAGWPYVLLGFALFRFFDIAKPFPVAQTQNLPGGYGIVVDDVIAGVYAALILQGVAWLMH
jgi:phosphatidylglycerophosphatase A